MNRTLSFLFLFGISFLLSACTKTETVFVVFSPENIVTNNAGKDLAKYLSQIYPGKTFEISREKVNGSKNIILEISPDAGLENDEAFRISGGGNQLSILGKTPRALLNGVYGLLEKLGYGFYLSMESKPPVQSELDFAKWSFSDSPLAEERIVFNWHNFLSGCSTWDFPEWRDWINRSSKMRFNTIMVHAYGNNPMFTYSFNGKQKRTSRLPATSGDRDWGTQQVNDVRRLHGGHVFDHPVFGAQVSQVDTEHHAEAVQKLMGQAFNYAKEQGLKICFAFDIDTYPANPQELINTLPSSSRFCISLEPNNYMGRYHNTFCMANPETPEGYAFYKSQIVSLLELYPQIDQVALWMRKSGSELLSFRVDQLPPAWQSEYKDIIKQHPETSAWKELPGRFAMGKVIAAFQKALKEIGREDIILKTGSWAFEWMEPSDLFFPKGLGFIGLDYNVLQGTSDIDLPEQQERITRISRNRPVTPIFWAHHDDGAYMGRPYVPVRDLQQKLSQAGAKGFGIIHWTTWPLDPYFKNMASQVWKSNLNEDYKMMFDKMAEDLVGTEQKEKTSSYLYEWATSSPMMGRETREWFIDRFITDQQTKTVTEGCERRLKLLEAVNENDLTETGKKYLSYFKGLEKFSMAFYRTENAYQRSLRYKQEGAIGKALEAIQQCKPEQIVAEYARFSDEKGITKGEKGIIITLNLEWISYIENQRQALGESPIRYNFATTVHPRFGQGLLYTNFFVDKEQNLWRNFGNEETGAYAYESDHKRQINANGPIPDVYEEICNSGIESDSSIIFKMRPFMADLKPSGPIKDLISTEILPGNYKLQLLFAPSSANEVENSMDLFVYNGHNQPAIFSERIDLAQQIKGKNNMMLKTYDIIVPEQGGVIVELRPVKGKANICGAILQRILTLN